MPCIGVSLPRSLAVMHTMREPEATEERHVGRPLRESACREIPDWSEDRSAVARAASRSPHEDLADSGGDRARGVTAGEDGETANLTYAEPTARLFEDLRRGFDAAVTKRSVAVREYFLAVAGGPVHLRVIGRDLSDHLLKPWKHLIISRPAHPDRVLFIDVWDENATQVRCQVRGPASSSRTRIATSADGRFRAQQSSHTLSCLDHRTGRLIASVVWDDRIPFYEWARPLSIPLIYWCEAQGLCTVHAGLISHAGKGVLLPGMDGAGKSTAALGCVVGGHRFLGDDLVGVQCRNDNTYLGHSLYGSVSIEEQHLWGFPEAARYAVPTLSPGAGKRLIAMWQAYPHSLQRSVRIQAIAIPRVVGRRESRIRPARKRDALIAAGVSTLLMIPQRDGRVFEGLSEMVKRLPCFWLELGHNVGSIATCVEGIIEGEAP